MSESVSIKEAAERLGVSADTVRRRLKRGELQGEKSETPQGFVWHIFLPEDTPAPEAPPGEDAVEKARLLERVSGLERLMEELKNERDAWREQASEQASSARELRILLRNAQELALPAHIGQGESAQAAREEVHEEGEAKKSLGARLRTWLRG